MKGLRGKIVLKGVVIMIIGLFDCCDYEPGGNCQFTPNELSHLYINVSSLVYDGHPIDFRDTIAFLYNSSDTIFAKVNTEIYGNPEPYDPSTISLYGTSRYEFNGVTCFKWATVSVIKDIPGSNADIHADIALEDLRYTSIEMNVSIDTAKILGKTYNNVYKFEFPANSTNYLKCIYFAKTFGFIKIEAADGRKLERLDL